MLSSRRKKSSLKNQADAIQIQITPPPVPEADAGATASTETPTSVQSQPRPKLEHQRVSFEGEEKEQPPQDPFSKALAQERERLENEPKSEVPADEEEEEGRAPLRQQQPSSYHHVQLMAPPTLKTRNGGVNRGDTAAGPDQVLTVDALEDDDDLDLADEEDEEDGRKRESRFASLRRHASKSSLLSTVSRVKEGMTVANIKKQADSKKLYFVVAFFFVVIIVCIAGALVLNQRHKGETHIVGSLYLEKHHRRVRVYGSAGDPDDDHVSNEDKGRLVMESMLGVGFPEEAHVYPCFNSRNRHEGGTHHDESGHTFDGEPDKRCLEWIGVAQLNITFHRDTNCYSISWQSLREDLNPTDCFPFTHLGEDHYSDNYPASEHPLTELEDEEEDEDDEEEETHQQQGFWYGGGETLKGGWPLGQKTDIEESAFVTGDEGKTEWGNIIRKFFLNSNGLSVSIEDDVPLFVSLDKKYGLCMKAKIDDFVYYYHRETMAKLKYTICAGDDIKALHEHSIPETSNDGHSQKDIDQLHKLLSTEMWQFHDDELNNSTLDRYVRSVIGLQKMSSRGSDGSPAEEHPFYGHLLLDHRWQAHMGDFTFDSVAFPNIKETMRFIREAGLTLVLTVNPFISTESENFPLLVRDGMFVGERNTSHADVPGLTWFQDVATVGLLDITDDATVDWLRQKMRGLLASVGGGGEESEPPLVFHVDSGNAFHTPVYFQFEDAVKHDNPDFYRDQFLKIISEEATVVGVSSAATDRPGAPAFAFMTPLQSSWRHLRAMVPNVLQLSVIDYPFVNPGPVGGIPRGEDPMDPDDEHELYVRWWQLNSFMPMLHYLKPPSAYRKDRITPLFHRLHHIRENVVLPRLNKFSNEALSNSTPIIRPLWMLDPHDPVAQEIGDQFAVGDEILVAPVLEKGSRARRVYLPRVVDIGDTVTWWKSGDGTFYEGDGSWREMEVELDEVLYFVRVDGAKEEEEENGPTAADGGGGRR